MCIIHTLKGESGGSTCRNCFTYKYLVIHNFYAYVLCIVKIYEVFTISIDTRNIK